VASITLVNGKWRALVRRKGHKAQCKTFRTKAQASAWGRAREDEIDAGLLQPSLGDLTMAKVFKAYRKLREASRPIADTSNEHYMLKALERGLAGQRVATFAPQHLVDYANMRSEEGAGPYTINMDVSKLGTVMRYAGAALGVVLPDVVGAARPLLTHLRLIGGGGVRERRPTEDELRRVLIELHTRRGLIYAEAVAFAACSAMRRGEVCAVLVAEIDPVTHIVPVWRKHPRKGKVLERVPLLGEAWDIAKRQPASPDGRLFPLHPGTLSKYFTEACRRLSIVDLHLHDMRHEGTSRLFEAGYSIERVALVTGHKKWETLKIYTQLKPEDLTKLPATPPARGTRPGVPPRARSLRSGSSRPGRS
jgi:integrase